MKRSTLLLFVLGLLLSSGMNAQEEEKKDFGIKFSGFVKNDFSLDSRQIVAARQGHFLLFPANVSLDADGNDINARPTFNYFALQSRLTGKITGPDAFGAKTSGVIEGAFFGQSEGNINSFRLRHAFVKLNWETTEVILGQYWHMMFVPGCFPGTVSFNTGVPFQFFSRNPQIRISQKAGNLKFSGVAATQLDFTSPGGSVELRNALLPDLSGQIAYAVENDLLVGVSAGYKQLLPRLVTDSLYKTSEVIGGFIGQAFFKMKVDPITFKIQAVYAQNGFNGLMLGGYAIKSIIDPLRDYREYTTINTLSAWTDIHTNGKKFQVGIFAGYTKNLGSLDEIDDLTAISSSTRGSNIAYAYRVSPRFIYNSGKVRFAAELERTGAAYGSSINENAVPQDTEMVINNRLLVAVFYFF